MERKIYTIYEDLVQSACESNLGRELTEKELKRLTCVFIDNDTFFSTIYGALVEASREAMNNDDEWKEYDKTFKDTPLEDMTL